MSVLKIIVETIYILFGLAIIVFGIMFEMDWYMYLLGIGLIAWAAYDIRKELRDVKKGSEVDAMDAVRDAIEKKIEEEE